MTNSNISEIIDELKKIPVCCLSTISATKLRSRMTHFGFSDSKEGLKFYISSLKTDPKVKQIIHNSQVSLLIYSAGSSFPEDKEIEVAGYAKILPPAEQKDVVELLKERSPVVAQLEKYNKLDMLAFIEISPVQIKFRKVKDILQGIPPTVIEFEQNEVKESEWEKIKKKVSAWLAETRYPFLTVTIFPVILGTVIAYVKTEFFNLFYFILTLLGAVSLHLGTNIINDYFDHKSGNDEANNEFVRPFSGGSRMIQLGLLTPLEVLTAAIIFFAVGIFIGLYLTFKCGLPVLILGLIGVISGFFYTAPILNWASCGFGELLVGLNFGILITLGSFYVQTKSFSLDVLLASIPLGILVSAILWINEFPDYNADKKVGKKTLVVRLGKKKASDILTFILLLPYLIIIFGVISEYLPKTFLFSFISLPFVIQAIYYLRKFYNNPFEMAAGNDFVILTFNIVAASAISAYLFLILRAIFWLPVVFLIFLYILWHNRIIIRQRETFLELKELYG